MIVRLYSCGDCEHTFLYARPEWKEGDPPSVLDEPRCPSFHSGVLCGGGCWKHDDVETATALPGGSWIGFETIFPNDYLPTYYLPTGK